MIDASMLLIGLGLLINALAVIGALRFPDAYTRAHAIGMGDTLGALLVIGGLMLWMGLRLLTLKLFLLLLIFFLINPTIVHAVLKAAWRAGLKPWQAGKRP